MLLYHSIYFTHLFNKIFILLLFIFFYFLFSHSLPLSLTGSLSLSLALRPNHHHHSSDRWTDPTIIIIITRSLHTQPPSSLTLIGEQTHSSRNPLNSNTQPPSSPTPIGEQTHWSYRDPKPRRLLTSGPWRRGFWRSQRRRWWGRWGPESERRWAERVTWRSQSEPRDRRGLEPEGEERRKKKQREEREKMWKTESNLRQEREKN